MSNIHGLRAYSPLSAYAPLVTPLPRGPAITQVPDPTTDCADAALSVLWAVLPEKGFLPLSTLGILLGPGGWRRQFGRLGTLQAFIETNSEFFDIITTDDTTLVGRAQLTTAAAGRERPPPLSRDELRELILSHVPPTGIRITQLGTQLGNWARNYAHLAHRLQVFLEQNEDLFTVDASVKPAVVYLTASPSQAVPSAADAHLALAAALPPGRWAPLPQLGTALGCGGWKVRFGHLGSLRAFLEAHPDQYCIDCFAKPQLVCRIEPTPAEPSEPCLDATTPCYTTAAMARDALLRVLPGSSWMPLPQLGSALGRGGWKKQFGHLGGLLPFLDANPMFFTVDRSQGATPQVRKGPDLAVLAEVIPVNVPEATQCPQQPACSDFNGRTAHAQHSTPQVPNPISLSYATPRVNPPPAPTPHAMYNGMPIYVGPPPSFTNWH